MGLRAMKRSFAASTACVAARVADSVALVLGEDILCG